MGTKLRSPSAPIRWLSLGVSAALVTVWAIFPSNAWAQTLTEPILTVAEEAKDMPVASTVRLLVILTGLSFLPAMLMVMTPFTRFIIVFSLLRQALGLQQSPPNQVLVGLAVFLSMLV